MVARGDDYNGRILFPTRNPIYNHFDNISVAWESQWTLGVDLSRNCSYTSENNSFSTVYGFSQELPQNGTYTLQGGGNLDPPQASWFPENCFFKMTPNGMYSDEYRSKLSIVGGTYTETYNAVATPVTILPISIISASATTLSTPSWAIHPPAELSTPGSPKSGLSPGAEAGVGVGMAVAAIAAVALVSYLYFSFKRRRKHETTTVTHGEGEGPGGQSAHEIDEKGWTIPYPKAELEGTPGPSRAEFDDRPELYGSTKISRLSSWSGGNTEPISDAQARFIENPDSGHSQRKKR